MSLWLVKNSGDLYIKNGEGFTPLHYICNLDQTNLLRNIGCELSNQLILTTEDNSPSLLHHVCENGVGEEMISLLISLGAPVDALDIDNRSPLHYACKEGDLNAAQCLVRFDASVNVVDRNGNSPIMVACSSGNVELVRWLMSQGASLYSCNNFGYSCLHLACEAGHLGLAQWLLSRGVDVTARNKIGASVRDVAVAKNRDEVVDWLDTQLAELTKSLPATALKDQEPSHASASKKEESEQASVQNDFGEPASSVNPTKKAEEASDVGTIDEEFGYFYELALADDAEEVTRGVQNGLDPNIESSEGFTVMHLLAENGNLKRCRKMLDLGTSPDKVSKNGLLPIHFAAMNGHLAVVKWLLQVPNASAERASVTDGRTILHHACVNGHLNVVEWLLKYGVNISALNSNGRTPYHDCCFYGQIPIAQVLIQNGVDMNERDRAGAFPLHIASSSGKLDVVQWLISSGAAVDEVDNIGRTPFMVACLHGHLAVAHFLAEHGANIRVKSSEADDFNTALHLACQCGNVDVIRWLVDCGLDLNVENKKKQTPMMVAVASRSYEAIRFIVRSKFSILDFVLTDEKYPDLIDGCRLKDVNKIKYVFAEITTAKRASRDRSFYGVTPIHFAAATGMVDLVKFLLVESDDKVDCKTVLGLTPLHFAAVNGHLEVVFSLISHGASPSLKDLEGNSALVLAMCVGNTDICKVLFYECAKEKAREMANLQASGNTLDHSLGTKDDSSKKKNQKGSMMLACIPIPKFSKSSSMVLEHCGSAKQHLPLQNTAIEYEDFEFSGTPFSAAVQDACQSGDVSSLTTLLQSGVSANVRNPLNACTPLHYACMAGHANVIRLLMEKGAKVDLKNIGGMTPLHIACDRKLHDIVILLLEYGADLLKKNNAGVCPLHCICSRGLAFTLEKVISLRSDDVKRSDLETRSAKELTPLHCAVEHGSLDVVKLLVKNNVQINPRDDEGRTPLHYACLKGYLEISEYLWKTGAYVNERDKKGRTPLLYACIGGHLPLLQWLLIHGADPHVTTDVGNNSLHAACRLGNLNIVIWLLQNGVDLNLRNQENITPAQCAEQAGQTELFEWLSNESNIAEYSSRWREDHKIAAME